ncbi:hypothetical protein KQH42_07390 [Streptomyces sp. CHA1]|uniref:hypothetical protein n=1 Tax=Streptomyces TaxID=1883 RepID=UPI001BFC6B5C|nr:MULTISPECIES: hypothetical protein [unclassified Streptomyces]MBT3157336.1 hypothetical protein [Streptomyces sp. G11C]MCO6700339.1 hypothetical protein [Streptomyces sp. CHB9.2]MCO6706475.1 hypothetical protein [Streptomyces sp. CHA3]MCO6712217.1 hypothetical protein [Streptomyces sp. CHB19.2]MCO6718651.1 hypothetical protein [Streptomyces sp. Vc714c-19]
MVRTEQELRLPPLPRRTDGERRRRQALADNAAGHIPGERKAPSGVERFQVVIYLCAAPNADINRTRAYCEDYARTFGWEITGVIEDRVGLLPPAGREGLERALQAVEEKRAGAVLTAWRSMISTIAQEYDEVAREIEKRGGFLHVMNLNSEWVGES